MHVESVMQGVTRDFNSDGGRSACKFVRKCPTFLSDFK
jgi:hypothetical protein